MRIWFIEIGEPLPVENGKRLLRYGMFTNWLAQRGHDVTWWGCNFSHAAKAFVADPGERRLENGVRLVLLPGRGYKKNLSVARMRHHRDFARSLNHALAAETQRPDLIVCPIPTVENAGVIAAFAQKHDIPYMLDIRDHWPDDLANRAPHALRPVAKLALHSLYKTARRAAAQAASVTGVTRLQRDYGLSLAGRRADPARDPVFYLGYTRTVVSDTKRDEALHWWHDHGLKQNAKIVAFTGTLGISFDFAPMLDAARRFHEAGRDDVQFVIAGDGGTRESLIKAAGSLAGKTVLFPGWIDQPKIDVLLSRSTMALAPYIPNTSMSLPNKFFEYMAYGLPVLSSCTGESAELIQQHNFGIQYDPKDMDGFYKAVQHLADNPTAAQAMRQAALTLFEARFNQSILFEQMEAHLQKIATRS